MYIIRVLLLFVIITLDTGVSFSSSEFLSHAQYLGSFGIIRSQNLEQDYRLSSTISRAEATKLALSTAGVGQRDCRTFSSYSYHDVDKTLGDLCGYIEGAVQNNIVVPANSNYWYTPSKPINRGDFASLIVGAFDTSNPSFILYPLEGNRYYTDVSSYQSSNTDSSSHLVNSINRLATTGCLNLNLLEYRPKDSITRGESFKIMSCLRKKYETAQSPSNQNTTTSNTTNNQNTTTTTSNTNQSSSTGTTSTTNTQTGTYSWFDELINSLQ